MRIQGIWTGIVLGLGLVEKNYTALQTYDIFTNSYSDKVETPNTYVNPPFTVLDISKESPLDAAAETIIGKIGNVTLSIKWVPTTHTRIKYMQTDGTPSESFVLPEEKTIDDTFWSHCKYDSRPYEIIDAVPFEVSGWRGGKRKLTAKQGNNVIESMEVKFFPKIGISLEEMSKLSTMDAFQAVSEGSIHMHPSQTYALLCIYKDSNTSGEVTFERLPLVQDQSQMPKRIFWDFNTINDFDVRKLI